MLLSLSCSSPAVGRQSSQRRSGLLLGGFFLFSRSWCRITALDGSARWHLQTIACFAGKHSAYVAPAHQQQAASYCELAVSIQGAVRDETREEWERSNERRLQSTQILFLKVGKPVREARRWNSHPPPTPWIHAASQDQSSGFDRTRVWSVFVPFCQKTQLWVRCGFSYSYLVLSTKMSKCHNSTFPKKQNH